MKKSFIILLCFLQLSALLFAAPTAAKTHLKDDGTFETYEAGTKPTRWMSENSIVQDTIARTGEKAVKMEPKSSAAAYMHQYAVPTEPLLGENGILRFWIRRESADAKVTLFYQFLHDEDGNGIGTAIAGTAVTENLETTPGEWVMVEKTGVFVPAEAWRIDVKLTAEGAACYLDDIFFFPESENTKDDTPQPIYGDTGENPLGMLACNMDFESVADTVESNMWSNFSTRRTDTIAHDGSWSYHLTGSGDTVAGTTITTSKLIGGATYQAVLWINVVSSGGTINLKTEFFKNSNWTTGGSDYWYEYSRRLEPMGELTYGKWRKVVRTFVAPPDAAALRLFLYCFGSVDCYVDDISITQIAAPFYGKLETDAGVYYTDMRDGYGKATLQVNNISYDNAGKSVVFRLQAPDGAVGWESESILQNAEGIAECEFPLAALTEIGEAYTLAAVIGGDEAMTAQCEVYCYARPSIMETDGSIQIDGKPFQPLVGYHINVADYKAAAAAGINVVQSYSASAEAALAAAAEAKIKVLLVVYRNMKPAGHPENITATRATVQKYQNHEALLGYAIMDEPTVYFQDPSEYLMDSYKAIRDLDTVHPVWIVEGSADADESSIRLCSRYCDIFAIDHYVADKDNHLESASTKWHVEKAKAAMAPGRPLYFLADGGGVNHANAPESIRNQGWQAFLGGADAIGYYMLSGNINTNGLLDAIGNFTDTDYEVACGIADKTFLAQADGEVLWRHWVENGKTYTLALNRVGMQRNGEGEPVVPPLSKLEVESGDVTVSCTANLSPLETRLWTDEPVRILAAGDCEISYRGDEALLTGLYSSMEAARELICFTVLENGDTATLSVPETGGERALQLWTQTDSPLLLKEEFGIYSK